MPVEPLPLRDIHLPEPVSWWPPAPGWWLLLLLCAAVIAAVLLFKQLRQRRRLKRTVRAELNSIKTQYDENHDRVQLVKALSVLMRRASISYYPRAHSAGLTGEQWLQYLDSTAQTKGFEHGAGKILASAPYLPADKQLDIDCNEIFALCQDWLNRQPVRGESS